MTAATRQEVLSLYRRVLRIARTWKAQSALPQDTERERLYIAEEAQTLFRQNKQVTDPQSIKTYIEECQARIEIGLHYRNPYPRPTYLPPMGLATQKGRKLRAQARLRKQAKPIYLESHDETSWWCHSSYGVSQGSGCRNTALKENVGMIEVGPSHNYSTTLRPFSACLVSIQSGCDLVIKAIPLFIQHKCTILSHWLSSLFSQTFQSYTSRSAVNCMFGLPSTLFLLLPHTWRNGFHVLALMYFILFFF